QRSLCPGGAAAMARGPYPLTCRARANICPGGTAALPDALTSPGAAGSRPRAGILCRPRRPHLPQRLLPEAATAQHQLAQLARGALSSLAPGDEVHRVLHLMHGVGGTCGPADPGEGTQIVGVIAHVRRGLGRDPDLVEQRRESRPLVLVALVDRHHPELATAHFHLTAAARSENRGRQPDQTGHHDAVAVLDVEALEGLAFRSVIQAAVGEDAIHVEDQQADARGALEERRIEAPAQG